MTTITAPTPVLTKIIELCETIVSQPEFDSIRQRVDAFAINDEAKALYRSVVEKGESLQQKKQRGQSLDDAEIDAYEKGRDALLSHSVAKDYINAQEEMQKVQQSVEQYVVKTFELGRIPTDEDFSSEGCGSGCGCHH